MRILAIIVASVIGLIAGKDGWVTQIQCSPPPCKPWATMKPMPPMEPFPPMKPLGPLLPIKPLPPLEPLPPMKPMEPFQWQWQSLNQAKGQKNLVALFSLFRIPSSMSSYTLTYFECRGRAEVARQLFYLAGVPFKDVRISMAEWPNYKHKAPFGQLPILEVNGKVLPQSFAIFRYLANEFGFAGHSPYEKACVDALADLHKDYMDNTKKALYVLLGFEQGDVDQLVEEISIPERDKYFTILEGIANDNSKSGYFICKSLTWFDLLIADFVETLLTCIPDHLDDFPAVLQTVKNISETPRLKEWNDASENYRRLKRKAMIGVQHAKKRRRIQI